jgi:hypothetical protein
MNLKDYIPGVSKFWVNVAYFVATYCVLYESRQDTLDWLMLLVYLAVVGGSSVALKLAEMWFNFKSGQAPK